MRTFIPHAKLNARIITTGSLFVLLGGAGILAAQTSVPYQDLTHTSTVFGHEKYYRLYLPSGYEKTERRYPVVYFFHGWGGRHFKDDNAKLAYEKLQSLIDRFQVIMVMWDGNIDEKEPRPYNVGDHKDVRFQVQMCDYFTELVAHIDGHYRTLSDRNNRGIIGFSMGGFISYFLAGKFPDMVVSAVSMAGSPEFFVGHPDDHTLYPIRYTFRNLQGVNLRLHNGDSDILFYLNTEVREGALWEGIPLDYWQFHGGHVVDKPGETKVFESALRFTSEAFRRENPLPGNWTHLDLYPVFDVWGYHVETNKREPGFIVLGEVDGSGFFVQTRRWLPDGPPLGNVFMSVRTPPTYAPLQRYHVVRYVAPRIIWETDVISTQDGRLSFDSLTSGNHIGISREAEPPRFVCLDYTVGDGGHFLSVHRDNKLIIRLFNRGGERSLPQTIKVTVDSKDLPVSLAGGTVNVQVLPGRRVVTLPAMSVSCSKIPPIHAGPASVRLTVSVNVDSSVRVSDLRIPVRFDVPFFSHLRFDDGGTRSDSSRGQGNADGVPDAGERIMVYQGAHRLRLYMEDPWVINDDERAVDEIIPAVWPDGYTLSSVIHISPECPDGHECECLASYESKSFNPIERNVTWGKVRFTVRHR